MYDCMMFCLVTLSNQSVPVVSAGSMEVMRDVHFVRLLSVILESTITADTSVVLTLHTSISKLLHPI